MIVKIDATTETQLSELERLVVEQTGLKPQSKSLMAQVVLKWAIKRVKGSSLYALAPQMLSLAQQRKALINDLIARQEQMDGAQLKKMMNAIGKITKRGDKIGAPSAKDQNKI